MNRELPKYCKDCGARLEWGEPIRIGFNEMTGKRRFYFQLICPKKKWSEFFHEHPYRGGFDGTGRYKIRYSKVEEL